MYTPGKLIYFDPFFFKNGDSKPKYFLVVKVIESTVILASLPSSQVHLPLNLQLTHGCLEIQDSGINCYIFQAKRPITKSGWCFELDTFLYGMWLDDFKIDVLNANYSIKGVDYEEVGELMDDELQNVIDCFRNSSIVKRKYRRWLT